MEKEPAVNTLMCIFVDICGNFPGLPTETEHYWAVEFKNPHFHWISSNYSLKELDLLSIAEHQITPWTYSLTQELLIITTERQRVRNEEQTGWFWLRGPIVGVKTLTWVGGHWKISFRTKTERWHGSSQEGLTKTWCHQMVSFVLTGFPWLLVKHHVTRLLALLIYSSIIMFFTCACWLIISALSSSVVLLLYNISAQF